MAEKSGELNWEQLLVVHYLLSPFLHLSLYFARNSIPEEMLQ
jgi:hypothetical protein